MTSLHLIHLNTKQSLKGHTGVSPGTDPVPLHLETGPCYFSVSAVSSANTHRRSTLLLCSKSHHRKWCRAASGHFCVQNCELEIS